MKCYGQPLAVFGRIFFFYSSNNVITNGPHKFGDPSAKSRASKFWISKFGALTIKFHPLEIHPCKISSHKISGPVLEIHPCKISFHKIFIEHLHWINYLVLDLSYRISAVKYLTTVMTVNRKPDECYLH